MADCSIDDAGDTSTPVETHIILEKVTVKVGILSPPSIDSASEIEGRDSS